MAKGSSIPETLDHIKKVQECVKTLCAYLVKKSTDKSEDLMYLDYISQFCAILTKRGEIHDKSKMEDPEVEVFDEFTPKLKTSKYGSEEYNGFLISMKPALDHHYAFNRHHPEYHRDGVTGMNLVDLSELFCDWKAATLRHDTGNLIKSIEDNKNRFKMSEPLSQVLLNSVKIFEPDKESLGIDICNLIIHFCLMLTDGVDSLYTTKYKVIESEPSIEAPQLTSIIRNTMVYVQPKI